MPVKKIGKGAGGKGVATWPEAETTGRAVASRLQEGAEPRDANFIQQEPLKQIGGDAYGPGTRFYFDELRRARDERLRRAGSERLVE